MERHARINVWYFILAFRAVLWMRDLWVASQHVEQIPDSQFQRALEEGRIQDVEILDGARRGTYREAPTVARHGAD